MDALLKITTIDKLPKSIGGTSDEDITYAQNEVNKLMMDAFNNGYLSY